MADYWKTNVLVMPLAQQPCCRGAVTICKAPAIMLYKPLPATVLRQANPLCLLSVQKKYPITYLLERDDGGSNRYHYSSK